MKLADCVDCDRRLNSSVYILTQRGQRRFVWKSCPSCSKRNGLKHEFKLFTELTEDGRPIYSSSDFGFSTQRRNPSNPMGGQSLCSACRSTKAYGIPGLQRSQVGGEVLVFGEWKDIMDKL